jgi:hypothetical protein
MEHSEDKQVIDLLTKLKGSNGGYPSDMLAARRRTYLRQMTNVGLGIGIGAGLKATLRGGGNGAGSAATAATSKVLEIVLIAAITIEAGTAAYLYRDKIANAIQSYISKPTTPEVSSPSSEETSSTDPIVIEVLPTLQPTISGTPSGTPSGIPSTSVAGSNNQSTSGQNDDSVNNMSGNDGTYTGVQANATPDPGENQGNQYGLTPKPIRTKENSGSGASGGNSSESTNDGGGGGNNDGGGGNKHKP